MRFFPILFCSLCVSACSQSGPHDDAIRSDTSVVAGSQAALPTGPDVRHFGYTEEVLTVVEGAGCGYRAPGMTTDSSLFASSVDAVIRVGRKIEVLKLVSEGAPGDSTTTTSYENAAFRVELRMQIDSVMEGGVAEHGEMTVKEKQTGAKTTLPVVGGCGC